MDKAHAFVGGYPIGPKCYVKKFGKPARIQKTVVTINNQPDLFDQLVDNDILDGNKGESK